MKNLTLTIALLLASTFGMANSTQPNVHVLSVSHGIFYFKLEKSFIGAEIKIYSADGQELKSETIYHRKALVDFFYGQAGHYIIKIKKDGVEEVFEYDKSRESEPNANGLMIFQNI